MAGFASPVPSTPAVEMAGFTSPAPSIPAAQEFYLRSSEVLRRLDLAVEVERRNAVELIPQKQAEAAFLHVAEWLRIAFAQFLSSESRSQMGIKDPARNSESTQPAVFAESYTRQSKPAGKLIPRFPAGRKYR
jgi:hypothetical protein